MTTKINNLVVPEIFAPYFSEQSVLKNAFIQSGIVEVSPQLTQMISNGGYTGNMPFFKQLSGADEVLNEDNPLEVGGTTALREIYAVLARGRAFGATDLAKAFSGADPMRAIGDMVSDYWQSRLSVALVNTLTGVFAGSGMSGLVHDITGLGTGKDTINASTVVDAKSLLGDNAKKITAIAVHSKTFATLQKEQLIVYVRNADYNIEFATYLGLTVIVDDTLPVDAVYGKYTSYLFTNGAIAYGGNSAPIPVETDRDTLSGVDVLVTRYHFVMHPRGMSIDVSGIAGITPTNAELAGDIWTRVFETKNMGIIKFVHKV
jgi:hypothetical protein